MFICSGQEYKGQKDESLKLEPLQKLKHANVSETKRDWIWSESFNNNSSCITYR